jgi:hypothetical protein
MTAAAYDDATITYDDLGVLYGGIVYSITDLPVRYRVELWDMTGANFGPGNLIAEFKKAVNVGWADYLNDVPEAFFTISQDDSKVGYLNTYKFKAHIKIYRGDDLVWGGILGEWEANERDVIVYAYGYLAILHVLLSAFNVAYTNGQIDTIVSDAWTRAKTTLTSSLLGWITTGFIEAPVTTSGGSTAIVLPSYRMFYKRTLQLLREMAALGIGDTTNTVVFEITPDGVFNFWKNRGRDTSVVWHWGGRGIKGFSESHAALFRRNDLRGVGNNPNDATLKYDASNSSDITTYGRRMEPVFFSWVRDSLELERGMKARLARSIRDTVDLSFEFYPNQMIPPGAAFAGWRLSDRVTAKVNRGATQIDGLYMAVGVQVLWVRGSERVKVLLQERPGS